MKYDYVIVGGGPSGLTLATVLPGKIALVERHGVLGGCHRFDSTMYSKFVEHGPRVYSGAYVNVKALMRDHLGLAWDDLFVPVSFSPENIDGSRWYQWLSTKEIFHLTVDYLVFALCNKDHGKDISMKTYCLRRSFSKKSLAYIDLVCRYSDGAGADRYSLWEFVSGFDQHVTSFYVPRQPNDTVFGIWHQKLRAKGVDVFLNSNVTQITKSSVAFGDTIVNASKVILCVPPLYADRLLKSSGLQDSRFRDFAVKTKYDMYWSVTYFGVTVATSQKLTPWGIVAVPYPFLGVVSAAASVFDVTSPVTGKTLAQTLKNPEEVAKEIRRQLGFSADVKYAYATGKYNDQAFVAAAKRGYFPAELKNGVAVVGCHNGHSTYHFTSMESAVQNALVYAKKTPVGTWHLSDYLRLGLLGTCVGLAFRKDQN